MSKTRHTGWYIRRMALALLALLLHVLPALAQFVQIESPINDAISHRDRIAVIAQGRPNFPMTLTVNGVETQTLTVRPDMKADFLNIAVPHGPSLLKVTQTLPNGMVFADSVRIHVVGPAAQIDMIMDPPMIPADSVSQAVVTIRVLDEWGLPLADGYVVNVYLDHGTVMDEDLYPNQPGIQVQVRNGQAVAHVLSPAMVSEGRLRVTADKVSTETDIGFTQPFQPWTLTGTAQGQIGYRVNKAPPAGTDPGEVFGAGPYSEGKLAFFGRGSLTRGLLLTTSYDSDRRYDQRVFRFLTPDRFFPIHGDASSIFYEAPSASRLYVRLTHDQSYMQYGDFATNLARTELLSYARSFTGVSTVWKQNKTMFTLFGASTDQAIQVDQIPGEGISGLYYLTASSRGIPIVEGSERVVLQTRDRLHEETVLKEEQQYRFTDYEIDYDAGTLLFKRPVPFRTPNENPIIIVVTYETARALENNMVGGGRLGFMPHENVDVAATIVGEERATQNFWLTGLDTEWRPNKSLTFTTELARTSSELAQRTSQDGWAFKVGAKGRLRERVGYELYYRDADRLFDNPSSPTARPGVRKVRGRVDLMPWHGFALQTEAFWTNDDINGESRVSGAVGTSYRYKTFTNKLKLESTQVERQGRTSNSAILSAGSEWAAMAWLHFGALRDQAFGSQDVSYRPTLNRLTTRVDLNDRIELVGEHAFRDQSFTDSSFTAIGIQSRVAGDLTAYANYELDGGINGYRNQAIVGLRHKYRPHEFVSLNGGLERVSTLRGNPQSDFIAFSIAGEYLPPQAIKASGRYEIRDGKTLDKQVASGAFDLTLRRGFSLLAKHTFLNEERTGTTELLPTATQRSHHFLSGLAYRGAKNDYVNTLGKYEYKYDRNSLIIPSLIRSVHIGSLETIVEPWSQTELFLRYGIKVNLLDSEGISTRSLTDLWMTNLRYEWRRQFDLLGEYRLLYQHTANDFKHGASLELGVIPQRSVRIALGYNFTGFDDRDFSGNSYWAHGPFLKFQLKFTEHIVAGWLGGLQSFGR